MSSSQIRVLAVDDHALIREGIAALIANQKDIRLAAASLSRRLCWCTEINYKRYLRLSKPPTRLVQWGDYAGLINFHLLLHGLAEKEYVSRGKREPKCPLS